MKALNRRGITRCALVSSVVSLLVRTAVEIYVDVDGIQHEKSQ